MIPYQVLEKHLNNLSYIKLLKDVRKVNLPIDKLYQPDRELSGKLIGTRVRFILDAILGKDAYTAKKVHYHFRWFVTSKLLNSLYYDADSDFYSYFSNHPDVRMLCKKFGNPSLSGQDFTIFEYAHDNDIDTLSYNKHFLFQIRQFKSFVDAVKELLPSIQQSWVSKRKEKKDIIQEKYESIATRKKTVLDFRR